MRSQAQGSGGGPFTSWLTDSSPCFVMGKSNSKLHPLDQELRAKVVIKSWKKEDLEMQMQDNPEVKLLHFSSYLRSNITTIPIHSSFLLQPYITQDPMVMVEYGIYLAKKEGNFKEAEQMFERALHMDRNNPDACGAYHICIMFILTHSLSSLYVLTFCYSPFTFTLNDMSIG